MALIFALITLVICYAIIFLIYRLQGKTNQEAHKYTIHSADLVKWILLVVIFVGFIGWAIYDSFR